MTDRLNALTVVLEDDIRVDDAEEIIAAIGMVRGVVSAEPHVADLQDHIAYSRARSDLSRRIWDALHKKEKEPR